MFRNKVNTIDVNSDVVRMRVRVEAVDRSIAFHGGMAEQAEVMLRTAQMIEDYLIGKTSGFNPQ